MIRIVGLVLISVVTCSFAEAEQGVLSFDAIEQIFAGFGETPSLDRYTEALKTGEFGSYSREIAMAYGTDSPQGASWDRPRIFSFGAKGKFIQAYRAESRFLEALAHVPGRGVVLGRLDTTKPGAKFEINPKSCFSCHAVDPTDHSKGLRPLVNGDYPNWRRMFGVMMTFEMFGQRSRKGACQKLSVKS